MLEYKANHLTFSKPGKPDKCIEIPCFTIKNNESKKLNIISDSVMLGNNRIPTGGGAIVSKLYDLGYVVNIDSTYQFMYEHYNVKSHHQNIISGRTSFFIEPGHTVMFPFAYFGSGPLGALGIKSCPKKSLLFYPEKHVSISLNVGGREWEYGLKKLSVYETYINFVNGCEGAWHIEDYISQRLQ